MSDSRMPAAFGPIAFAVVLVIAAQNTSKIERSLMTLWVKVVAPVLGGLMFVFAVIGTAIILAGLLWMAYLEIHDARKQRAVRAQKQKEVHDKLITAMSQAAQAEMDCDQLRRWCQALEQKINALNFVPAPTQETHVAPSPRSLTPATDILDCN